MRGGQLPELLVAEREGLRAVSPGELEAGDQLLRDRAARAFGQHGERRLDVHSGSEIRTRLAVAGPPHVADAHAFDCPGLIEKCRCGREARKDLDPERLGLGREPGRELPE